MSYNRKTSLWKTIDWFTIFLYLILIVAGWISICGASYEFDSTSFFDPTGRPGSQLMWIGLSSILIFIILMLESDMFDVFAYFAYGAMILLLIATIFLAPDVKGSHSWLVLGSFRIQPAEFAKFITALALAKMIGSYGFKLNKLSNFFKAVGLVLLPMFCIILQRETGSALVYLAFFLVLYREGMSGYVLLTGVCMVMIFVVSMKLSGVLLGITPLGSFFVYLFILLLSILLVWIEKKDKLVVRIMLVTICGTFLIVACLNYFMSVNYSYVAMGLLIASILFLVGWSIHKWLWHYALIALFSFFSLFFMYSVDYVFNEVLEPHQQLRILVALGLENDPSGAGYNVNQSKIAIGSGGFTGKGFFNGTQTKLKYVPEQDTDFIFCTIGEEQGFIGSMLVLIVFGCLIIRLIVLAERQSSVFNRVYGYSVAAIFFFHVTINIGMVIGLMPVIGIPLPFFSYGGSSLWGFTILLFIFLRLDATRREK